jgi:phosphatidylglycerol:prolipoprotein diacylglycerol transferase
MLNFWGISFHIYGLVLGLGIVMAKEVVMRVARERKFDEKLLNKIFIVGVVGGVIGARLYHVLDNFDYYSENVVKIFLISEGGLGIWGLSLEV